MSALKSEPAVMLVEVSLNLSTVAACVDAPISEVVPSKVGSCPSFCGFVGRVFVSEMISSPFVTVISKEPSDKVRIVVTVSSSLLELSEDVAEPPDCRLLTI